MLQKMKSSMSKKSKKAETADKPSNLHPDAAIVKVGRRLRSTSTKIVNSCPSLLPSPRQATTSIPKSKSAQNLASKSSDGSPIGKSAMTRAVTEAMKKVGSVFPDKATRDHVADVIQYRLVIKDFLNNLQGSRDHANIKHAFELSDPDERNLFVEVVQLYRKVTATVFAAIRPLHEQLTLLLKAFEDDCLEATVSEHIASIKSSMALITAPNFFEDAANLSDLRERLATMMEENPSNRTPDEKAVALGVACIGVMAGGAMLSAFALGGLALVIAGSVALPATATIGVGATGIGLGAALAVGLAGTAFATVGLVGCYFNKDRDKSAVKRIKDDDSHMGGRSKGAVEGINRIIAEGDFNHLMDHKVRKQYKKLAKACKKLTDYIAAPGTIEYIELRQCDRP